MSSCRFGGRWLKGTDVIPIPDDHPGPYQAGEHPRGVGTFPAQEILGFAYSPAIIHTTSPPDTTPRYYMFFGMGDYHRSYATDQIGFTTSADGLNWNVPKVTLHVTNNSTGQNEGSVCDPSVALMYASGRADVDGFYYLFYSANIPGYETVMCVARSSSLYGPFQKYCGKSLSGTPIWGGDEPVQIISPMHAPVAPGYYGAGEQTVIVHTIPDGVKKFLSWHSDDSENAAPGQPRSVFFATSLNAVDWSPPINTNITASSIDVKFDDSTGTFHMYYIAPKELEAGTFLARRVSQDGINWNPEERLCDPYAFPTCAHNVGVSGNPEGRLLAYSLVGYGGPPSGDNIDRVFAGIPNPQPWDLYFHVLGDSMTFDRGYFQFPAGGPTGTFFSDGVNWVAFLTAQDFTDHQHENPHQPDVTLGSRSHTQVGTFAGPWHSGMPIPP